MADEPRGGDRLDVLADPSDVPAAIDDHDADAVAARQPQRGRGRELGRELAPSPPAVDPGDRAALERHGGLGRRLHLAALDELDVRHQPEDAVRVVARDVGLDERPRDHVGLLGSRAGRDENRRRKGDQVFGGKEEILAHNGVPNG